VRRLAIGRAMVMAVALAACKGEPAKPDDEAHDDKGHDDKGHDDEAHDDKAHAGEPGAVHLNPAQVAAAGIQTAAVEIRRETAVLEANGQIEAAGDHQARVGVRVPGRISALRAGLGDTVKKGQVLALVESPELGRAKADYVAASAGADVAAQTAARERLLVERKISSESEWKSAEAEAVRTAAELQAAENRLHALGVGDSALPDKVGHFSSTMPALTPIAGVVVERPVTLGEMVDPEDTLFVVMDLAEVWLLVDVFERDLSQVALGQKVTVTLAAYPERTFTGKVDHIGAIVESRSRAVKVRVALANADGALKPGMFGRVALSNTRGEHHEHLFVPAAAVQRTERGPVVFVPGDEAGAFVARPVRTGHEVAGSIAIESGLTAGETVVVAGSFILKSELDKGALGAGGHSH
jgi:cobalt-zinc-cadmium efflux system membrane fusion protein